VIQSFKTQLIYQEKKTEREQLIYQQKKKTERKQLMYQQKKNREEAVDTTFTYSYEIIYYCKTIQEGQQNIANKLLRLHS
jgi:hypothetical protein